MDFIGILLLIIIIIVVASLLFIRFSSSGKDMANKYLPGALAYAVGAKSISKFSTDDKTFAREKAIIEMVSRSDLIPNEIKQQITDKITNGQLNESQIMEILKPYIPPETIAQYLKGATVESSPSVGEDPLIEKSMNKNLLSYHMQIDPSIGARNVLPNAEQSSVTTIGDSGSISEMLATIKNDSPAVKSNGEFLPGSVKQNVPSNSIISSRIIYQRKPKSRLIDRHGDPRPYPDTQVNMILGSNGKDPNSLRFSEFVNPYDTLQSGRGVFGSEYVDSAMEKMENAEMTGEGKKTLDALDRKIGDTAPVRQMTYNDSVTKELFGEMRNPTQRVFGTNAGGALSY